MVTDGDETIMVNSGDTIKVDPNGGSWVYNGTTYTTSMDVTVTASITLGTPTRTGYNFTGWTKGTAEGYAATFTAQWQEGIVVTYGDETGSA